MISRTQVRVLSPEFRAALAPCGAKTLCRPLGSNLRIDRSLAWHSWADETVENPASATVVHGSQPPENPAGTDRPCKLEIDFYFAKWGGAAYFPANFSACGLNRSMRKWSHTLSTVAAVEGSNSPAAWMEAFSRVPDSAGSNVNV